jgi:hypothetical protein
MHYRRKWASGVRLILHSDETADEVTLCNGCLEYVTATKSRNDDGSIVWQCFECKILRDHFKRMQLWMIMPRPLREWWIEYGRGSPNMNDILIDRPEPFMRDGTAILEELKKMTSNLGEVGWRDFQNIWEKHQSVPLVRRSRSARDAFVVFEERYGAADIGTRYVCPSMDPRFLRAFSAPREKARWTHILISN